MVAPATATSLTSSFLPTSGFRETTRSLHFRQPSKKQCIGKSVPGIITAKIELKPPPYEVSALEPHMSQETLEYHWGKHHRGYVDNLNKQIVETELDEMTLEDIILTTYNKGNILPAFNNAAQVWNHDFFWESMKPGGMGKPSGDLLELINRDFGSFEAFINEFKSAASTQFGSGWAWLVYKENTLKVGNAINPYPSEKDKKLVVVKSPNAVNPLVWDYSPLLTIDVWEHAYYLDFQNRRPDYVSNFMDKLVSWEKVSSRLETAKAQAVIKKMKRRRPGAEAEESYLDSDAEDSEAVES